MSETHIKTDRWIQRPLEFIMYWWRLLFLALLCERRREKQVISHNGTRTNTLLAETFGRYIGHSSFGKTFRTIWWKRLSNFTLTKHDLHWNNIYENAILTASSAVLQIQLRENNILYQVLLRISKGLSTELCFLNETKIFGATSKFYTVLYIFWTLENCGRYVFGHYPQKFGDSGVTTLITQSQAKGFASNPK